MAKTTKAELVAQLHKDRHALLAAQEWFNLSVRKKDAPQVLTFEAYSDHNNDAVENVTVTVYGLARACGGVATIFSSTTGDPDGWLQDPEFLEDLISRWLEHSNSYFRYAALRLRRMQFDALEGHIKSGVPVTT